MGFLATRIPWGENAFRPSKLNWAMVQMLAAVGNGPTDAASRAKRTLIAPPHASLINLPRSIGPAQSAIAPATPVVQPCG